MDTSEYGQYLMSLNEAAYASILMSMGQQWGLFDLMMKENRPLTSCEIAELAGMKERYVREWLHGVATGKIVQYDDKQKTFYIPENHQDSLKWTSAWTVWVGIFAARTKEAEKVFKKDEKAEHDGFFSDKGFADDFSKMFSQMKLQTSNVFVERYLMPSIQNSTAVAQLESGIDVIDVCCGSGDLSIELALKYPMSNFTGLDIMEMPLAVGKDHALSKGAMNVSFIQGDVQNLSHTMSSQFDMVLMCDALHNLPDPFKALTQIHKILRENGILFLLELGTSSNLEDDIGNLKASLLYVASINYCLPSSMSAEPRKGFGAGWGHQELEKAVMQHFIIKEIHNLDVMMYRLYICTKS